MIFSLLNLAFIVLFNSLELITCQEYFPPKDVLEMLEPLHNYCVKEVEVTEDQVKNYNIVTDTNKNMKCYIACMMKLLKWMSPGGEIFPDYILSHPWESMKEILITNVNKCKNIKQFDDECDTAFNFVLCLHDVDLEHWFVV